MNVCRSGAGAADDIMHLLLIAGHSNLDAVTHLAGWLNKQTSNHRAHCSRAWPRECPPTPVPSSPPCVRPLRTQPHGRCMQTMPWEGRSGPSSRLPRHSGLARQTACPPPPLHQGRCCRPRSRCSRLWSSVGACWSLSGGSCSGRWWPQKWKNIRTEKNQVFLWLQDIDLNDTWKSFKIWFNSFELLG